MVSILPSERSPFDVVGKMIGQQLSQNLPGAVQQGYNRGQLQQSLESIRNLSNTPGTSPLDITLEAMKAGAGIPGSERYLGQLIPLLTQYAQAHAGQKAPLAGEQRQPLEPIQQRQQLPGFLGQQQQQPDYFPTNIGPQGGPGNVPQAATTGQKVHLLTPQEQIKQARELAKERTAAGIPTTPKEALAEVQEAEKTKKIHNADVDKELAQRVEGQKTYGERAVDYLKDVYPKASPEVQTIFQKLGEDASKRGESDADINRFLAKEAAKFKNAIVNVQKEMSAPRLQNFFTRAFEGTYKDVEKASNDLRSHLKPILDLGLYDTARNLLTDLGYYPEEREAIINPLSERQKTSLNKVPEAIRSQKPVYTATTTLFPRYDYAPNQLENIKDGLRDLKEIDPNFSLVLARKAFEDKKYDWRMYRDALNELEEEGFKLTDDQNIQKGVLDTPPLSDIQRVLEGVNIIGR
jgi:hypothetical protein